MAAIPPGQDTAEQGETPAACLRPSEQHKVISYNISSAIMSQVANYPKWSDLPLDKSHPPNSAWFVWGKDDELGCLVSWLYNVKHCSKLTSSYGLSESPDKRSCKSRFSGNSDRRAGLDRVSLDTFSG